VIVIAPAFFDPARRRHTVTNVPEYHLPPPTAKETYFLTTLHLTKNIPNDTVEAFTMTTNAPTLINLPPPPSDPGTPGDAP
jgi:hypothetical protein